MARCLALVLLALALAASAAEPKRSTGAPKPVAKLSPLLGQKPSPDAKTAWEQRRKELRAEWLQVLGGLPEQKPPLRSRVLGTEELPEFTREHVEYQVEPGVFTDGYLLTPKGAEGKLPGLVVFHATTEFGARGPAGLAPAYPEDKWQGVQFARKGWLVWCPRNFINTPGTNYLGNANRLLQQHPTWTGMGRMLWDAIRAMDFLETCPRVDRSRIGCFGHSLGAKEVLYAMAFDDRYRAGVFSEGGIGLRFSNWDAPWYLGKRINSPVFTLEHHQLLGLIAPRPFLLIAGDSADDERSALFVSAVEPVYALYGAPKNLRFFNHHKGHVYDAEVRAEAENFLVQELARQERE